MDFRDERVCKFFITGMCPNDIFVNTKMDEVSLVGVLAVKFIPIILNNNIGTLYESPLRGFKSCVRKAW